MEYDDKTKLSLAFSNVLKSWLSPVEMAKVIVANSEELDEGICHSHDFCDANMAMHEAFIATMGRESQADSQADADLWNSAWDNAKTYHFYTWSS